MQLIQNTYFGEGNRYYLEKLLGRGGFSEVWLAKDAITDLELVLKVYAPGTGMDEDGLQTFSKELARVYHLNHPNLLRPQHVDSWRGMPYLLMAYCAQGSLVKRIGGMSEVAIRKVLHDVASGLAYLHAHDVIHQDIKPDNILLDDAGNYVITDFGISTRARSTLRKSIAASAAHSGGTIAYMGPERFGKEPAPIKASDVWSLGAMLYELIMGDTPFGEHGGLIQKSGAEIPTIQGNYSDELKQIVEQMLALNPWDRPTAEDLAAGYAVSSTPSAATASSTPTRNRPTVAMPTTSSAQSTPAPTTRQKTAPVRKRSTEVTPTTSSQSKSTPTPSAHPKETAKVLITILIFVLLGLGVTVGILIYNSHQEEVRNEQLAKAHRQAEENVRIAEQEKKAALERARQAEKQLKAEQEKKAAEERARQADERLKAEQEKKAAQANKQHGTHNGHVWVDLGLSVKWATCNLGATAPEEDGNYYAWGEVVPKSNYDWDTYKYSNGSASLTKYCTSSYYGTVDNKTTLEAMDDAASMNWGWGSFWRMPTYAEWTELREQCTWTWTTRNGVKGYEVTSNNNANSIFLPAAGYRKGTDRSSAGSAGYYWSSSLYSYTLCAWYVDFNSGYVRWDSSGRYKGQSVRPVCP